MSLCLLCMESFFLTSIFRFYENIFRLDFASRSGTPLFFLCQNAVVTCAGCYLLLWFQLIRCELPVAIGSVDTGTVNSDVLEDIIIQYLWVLAVTAQLKVTLAGCFWVTAEQSAGAESLEWTMAALVVMFRVSGWSVPCLTWKILLSVLSELSSRSSINLWNDICLNRSWVGWWIFWSAGSYRKDTECFPFTHACYV